MALSSALSQIPALMGNLPQAPAIQERNSEGACHRFQKLSYLSPSLIGFRVSVLDTSLPPFGSAEWPTLSPVSASAACAGVSIKRSSFTVQCNCNTMQELEKAEAYKPMAVAALALKMQGCERSTQLAV